MKRIMKKLALSTAGFASIGTIAAVAGAFSGGQTQQVVKKEAPKQIGTKATQDVSINAWAHQATDYYFAKNFEQRQKVSTQNSGMQYGEDANAINDFYKKIYTNKYGPKAQISIDKMHLDNEQYQWKLNSQSNVGSVYTFDITTRSVYDTIATVDWNDPVWPHPKYSYTHEAYIGFDSHIKVSIDTATGEVKDLTRIAYNISWAHPFRTKVDDKDKPFGQYDATPMAHQVSDEYMKNTWEQRQKVSLPGGHTGYKQDYDMIKNEAPSFLPNNWSNQLRFEFQEVRLDNEQYGWSFDNKVPRYDIAPGVYDLSMDIRSVYYIKVLATSIVGSSVDQAYVGFDSHIKVTVNIYTGKVYASELSSYGIAWHHNFSK
ncbi:MAG: hypothetical protein NC236_00475 [Mycoplasma sp.]|nr:hypothetical protein [Mycoplasma sp.]